MEPKKDGQGFDPETSSVDCMEDAVQTPLGRATLLLESFNIFKLYSNFQPVALLLSPDSLFHVPEKSLGQMKNHIVFQQC